MASISECSHGGKRDKSGRKRKYVPTDNWTKQQKRIYLSNKVFSTWRDAKNYAGYGRSSDSDFAIHLLSLEYRRRSYCNNSAKVREGEAEFIQKPATQVTSQVNVEIRTSTPLKGRDSSLLVNTIAESPVQPMIINDETEIDSNSCMVLEPSMTSHGSLTITADPLNSSVFTDDEQESSDDNCSDKDSRDTSQLAISILEERNSELDSESSEDDINSASSSDDESSNHENDEEIHNNEVSQCHTICHGPHRKLSRGDEVYALEREFNMVNEAKVICSLDLLIRVFQTRCQEPGCEKIPNIKYHLIGTTLVINSICSSGHQSRFCSSHEVNGIYVNNLLAAASILLSGNNFGKVERMANFYGLAFLGKSSYHRYQKLYLIPEVNDWWCWMRREILGEFVGKEIIVGGDGQCDSPGFNAKNLCYFMVESTTNYIIGVEILDKRHVGLISTNMEREAVKWGLENLQADSVKIVEFVTDASSSVKTLLEIQFKGITHSLDVWHKSKSIKKCLAKLGKPKRMKKIKDWSAHIVWHFWHCSNMCRKDDSTSDEEALKVMKDMWISLLHHVCNKHEWVGGKCEHEDGEHNDSLPWFDRRDEDFAQLQKVILNPELLASFKYYTRFRHTGNIECANSLSLTYTPKQVPFGYQAYKARKQLTAMDWNYHANIPQAKKKSGEERVTRKYNQRTRQWDMKVVKVKKGYEYIPILMAKILRRRENDVESVARHVSFNKSDPALISPTIAHIPAVATKDIVQRKSRFSKDLN